MQPEPIPAQPVAATPAPPLRWLALGQLLSTGLAIGLFVRALDEPFVAVRAVDVWTLVWLAGLLTGGQLLTTTAVAQAALRVRRPLVFAVLAWSVLVLLLLAWIPGLYIEDIAKFQGWRPPVR